MSKEHATAERITPEECALQEQPEAHPSYFQRTTSATDKVRWLVNAAVEIEARRDWRQKMFLEAQTKGRSAALVAYIVNLETTLKMIATIAAHEDPAMLAHIRELADGNARVVELTGQYRMVGT